MSILSLWCISSIFENIYLTTFDLQNVLHRKHLRNTYNYRRLNSNRKFDRSHQCINIVYRMLKRETKKNWNLLDSVIVAESVQRNRDSRGVRTISRNVDDKTKRQNEQRFLFNVAAVGVETRGARKPWFQPRGVSQVKQPTAVSSTCRVSYSAAKLWIQIRCANLLDVGITFLRSCAFVTQHHRQRSRVSSTHKYVFSDRSLGCFILRRCSTILSVLRIALHAR